MSFKDYFHAPAITAGFVAVLVGYSSSAVIVFQAASAAGATAAQTASWIMALGIGMALTTIGLSLRYRMPIVTAWSTPGAALLATSLQGISMPEAIGAFLFSALLITLCGITGWFERIIDKIPLPIAAAMLAGILFQFGVDVFVSMQAQFTLVLLMFAVYLVSKRFIARYAILLVLAAGFVTRPARLFCLRVNPGNPGVCCARVFAGRIHRRGHSTVRGHHGVAEHSRHRGVARRWIQGSHLAVDQLDRH